MKHFLNLVCIVMSTLSLMGCISAGVNSPITFQDENGAIFPIINGIDIDGNERIVPETFRGNFNLINVAFEREQQSDVNTWITQLSRLQLIYPTLQYYELPVIEKRSSAQRFWINNGMRSGIEDSIARARTITLHTDKEKFLSHMQMADDRIYTLLLDQDANIIWRAEGPVADVNLNELKEFLTLLSDPLKTF